MQTQRHNSRQSGFTLVEMVISTAIMVIMMGFLLTLQNTSAATADQTRLQDQAESTLARNLQRVADEMRSIADASIWEDLEGMSGASDTLTYQTVVSLNGAVATLGPVTRIATELETSEQLNNLDDDGDGLIDESALYLTRNVGETDEKRVLLCRGVTEYYTGETLDNADENGNGLVDEPGFHIAREGDRLVVRLAVRVTHSDGASMQREGEVSIEIRN